MIFPRRQYAPGDNVPWKTMCSEKKPVLEKICVFINVILVRLVVQVSVSAKFPLSSFLTSFQTNYVRLIRSAN